MWAEHNQLCRWVNHTISEQCVGCTVLSDQRNGILQQVMRKTEIQRTTAKALHSCGAIPRAASPGSLHHRDPCLHLSIPQLAVSLMWAKVSPSCCYRLPGWNFTPGNPCWAVKPHFLQTLGLYRSFVERCRCPWSSPHGATSSWTPDACWASRVFCSALTHVDPADKIFASHWWGWVEGKGETMTQTSVICLSSKVQILLVQWLWEDYLMCLQRLVNEQVFHGRKIHSVVTRGSMYRVLTNAFIW